MIDKSIAAGLAGETLSRKITGNDEVSVERSVVATGTGAGLGYLAGNGAVVGLSTLGFTGASAVLAPVVVPVMVGAAVVACVRSLFD